MIQEFVKVGFDENYVSDQKKVKNSIIDIHETIIKSEYMCNHFA